jgi:hypothetical protein
MPLTHLSLMRNLRRAILQFLEVVGWPNQIQVGPKELVYHLVRLGKEYSKHSTDEPWEAYYARALVASLSA